MSVREQLVKSLSLILRLSKATLQVLLADENGLSIAKVSRSSDIEIDPMAINSVSAATYNFSEEIWEDLGILQQRIAFAFFEKLCLITIRIDPTILTIVHDFNMAWPINADEIAKIIYQLRLDIDEMFGPEGVHEDVETFSTALRNVLYLFNMGNEIPFASYFSEDSSPEVHDRVAMILDGVQNPVFARYGIVAQDGLMFDGREFLEGAGSTIASFSSSTIVSFQKLVEEASQMNVGPLLSYICISGPDPENIYAILACPSGNIMFKDQATPRKIKKELAFISLFPLTYGMIPIFCETRNIVSSMLQLVGEDPVTKSFLNALNNLIQIKYQ